MSKDVFTFELHWMFTLAVMIQAADLVPADRADESAVFCRNFDAHDAVLTFGGSLMKNTSLF